MINSISIENRFIEDHQNDDPTRLLLQRDKWKDLDMERMVSTIEGRKKIRRKLPSWYEELGLRYPDRLCTEQCSSEATALYKAGIVQQLGSHRVADLTGGLGADSWAFSKVADEVLHNEMKPYLSEAVQRNMALLGCDNLSFSCLEIGSENIGEILDTFQPDLVFMDPARRDDVGKKVFLIEDCRPDVLTLKDRIFEKCRHIFLKLSPMADISMVAERLGNVRDVYVVSADGECKELLVVMEKDWCDDYTLHIKEGGSGRGTGAELAVGQHQEEHSSPRFFATPEALLSTAGKLLFEPGKAITKAGLFNAVGKMFGLTKLGRSTHLYIETSPVSQGPDSLTEHSGTGAELSAIRYRLSDFGKCFRILEVMESGNKSLKYLSKTYPQAEVTAKNLPITSDALRKKLKCSSGGKIHIFAVKADTLTGSGTYLFVTEREA